jgi:CO dehydrogenase nickel-insertion accessory protein CooC1
MIAEIKPRATEVDIKIAKDLRELADKLEAGDVSEIIIVANLRAEGQYQRVAKFDNAWKALGALEYAKQAVQCGMEWRDD